MLAGNISISLGDWPGAAIAKKIHLLSSLIRLIEMFHTLLFTYRLIKCNSRGKHVNSRNDGWNSDRDKHSILGSR